AGRRRLPAVRTRPGRAPPPTPQLRTTERRWPRPERLSTSRWQRTKPRRARRRARSIRPESAAATRTRSPTLPPRTAALPPRDAGNLRAGEGPRQVRGGRGGGGAPGDCRADLLPRPQELRLGAGRLHPTAAPEDLLAARE